MQRDIAAVVDVGTQHASATVRVNQMISDTSGNRCHRRDEQPIVGMRQTRTHHAPCNGPADGRGSARAWQRLAQRRKFAHQFSKHRLKRLPAGLMRRVACGGLTVCANHEVNRAVLIVPAAVTQPGPLRLP